MARTKQSRVSRSFLYFCIVTGALLHISLHAELTSLAKNDPYPLFSTLSLDDRFLLTKTQLEYKDEEWAQKKKSHLNLCITPFGQNASRGKTIKGQPCPVPLCEDLVATSICVPCPDEADTPLGDLTGRTGMIALLYGKFPDGVTTYPGGNGANGYLNSAFNALFCTPAPCKEKQGELTTEIYIDPLQNFGYFSFPLEYRKRGVRFELDALFAENFGIRVQAGVSSIRQVVEKIINRTNLAADPFETLSAETVDTYLMDQLDNIACEIKMDIGNIIQTNAEEIRLNLFWRQAFEMNMDSENNWTRFLLIPYFEAAGSYSPGKARNPNQLFAVPFGNNNHPSVGFTTGMNFDFIETIEIGGEIGFTHFFKKSFCEYPMPNSKFQTNLFPFKAANVTINPGNNWYFGGRLSAYHFLGNLSMYFEWFVLDHKQDKITIDSPNENGAFLPEVLEKTTTFKTKFGNAGFNYDIAPNIGLGFLWQMPFSQRNAYRSSTIMAGINFTF